MFLSRTCMLNLIIPKIGICALFIASKKRQALQRAFNPLDTGKLLEGVELSSGVSASSQELWKTQGHGQDSDAEARVSRWDPSQYPTWPTVFASESYACLKMCAKFLRINSGKILLPREANKKACFKYQLRWFFLFSGRTFCDGGREHTWATKTV